MPRRRDPPGDAAATRPEAGASRVVASRRRGPDPRAGRAGFLAKVLQTDEPKYDARWIRKRFREGLAPPPILGSDTEVLAFFRATPGASGYVSSSGDRKGIKVLQEF